MSMVRRGSVSGVNLFRNRSKRLSVNTRRHSALWPLLCGDVQACRAAMTELSIKLDTVTDFEPKVFVLSSKAEEAF
eukprot:6622759-Prymnesium_polylepis.1